MNQQEAKAQMTVWWVLWGAFQVGIVIIFHSLSVTIQQSQTQLVSSSAWLAGFAPLMVSIVIRWLVLPRIENAQSALTVFIVGIATAESTCFLGLYIFPVHKQELFIASVLGIFQFIPYFAGRYFPQAERR
jgi:hypothetical protein